MAPFFQIFPFSQKAKRKSTLLDIDQGSFFSFFQATQKIQFPLLSIQFVSFHSGLLLFFPRILFLLPRSCLETRKKELLFLSFSLPYASILSAFKGKYHFFPAWYFLLYIVFDIVGKTWFFSQFGESLSLPWGGIYLSVEGKLNHDLFPSFLFPSLFFSPGGVD